MTHTPLTKAEREEWMQYHGILSSSDSRSICRLLADLDAAEAERDEIKAALGVLHAPRERVLEVAGSQDGLEEQIEAACRARATMQFQLNATVDERDALKANLAALVALFQEVRDHHQDAFGDQASSHYRSDIWARFVALKAAGGES